MLKERYLLVKKVTNTNYEIKVSDLNYIPQYKGICHKNIK